MRALTTALLAEIGWLELKPFQEKQILCKTHRSILNSQVRQCNIIIKDLTSQITRIKDSINCKSTNKDFNNLSNLITKSKEKVFKTTKHHQIKKFNFLQKSPIYRNTPVPDIIKKKWIIKLSSKPLMDGEQSLLQKGSKFAVSWPKVPLTEYIALTKRICDELDENTTGKDCTEIYQKPKRFCNTTKIRRDTLATSPRKSERPSKPSGRMPLAWSSQQTRE